MLLDEGAHSVQGPEFSSEAARGAGPLAQHFGELLPLVGSQSRLTATGMGFGIESVFGVLSGGVAPSADRTGRGLDVSRDLPNAPAGLQEGDGDATSNFELGRSAFGSHRPLIGTWGQSL